MTRRLNCATRLFLAVALALLVIIANGRLNAHGGGLDASGGHNDHKAGNYHFHRGLLSGRTFASKAAGAAALIEAQRPKPAKGKDKQEK